MRRLVALAAVTASKTSRVSIPGTRQPTYRYPLPGKVTPGLNLALCTRARRRSWDLLQRALLYCVWRILSEGSARGMRFEEEPCNCKG